MASPRRPVNQSRHSVTSATVSDEPPTVFWVSNRAVVGLGEPFAETICTVIVGEQFPFTGKVVFLSVRSSFAVLEMSVELERFSSTLSH
jgi:hypothetical protein